LLERELTLQLTDSGAAVLVCLRSNHAIVAPVLESSAVRVVLCVDDRAQHTRHDLRVLPTAVPECPDGTVSFESVVDAGLEPEGGRDVVATSPDDAAFLTYTSGTTGPPKAAVNTHGQLAHVTAIWQDWTGTTAEDLQLGLAPLFHITGLVAVLSLGLLTGAGVVLTYRFEPSTVLDAVRETRPTVVTGAITGFMALAGAPGAAPEDFESWRSVTTGGAPVAPATADRFEQATGKHLHPGYGSRRRPPRATSPRWGRRARSTRCPVRCRSASPRPASTR
jgi:long-chain acyl-CoA synthetase